MKKFGNSASISLELLPKVTSHLTPNRQDTIYHGKTRVLFTLQTLQSPWISPSRPVMEPATTAINLANRLVINSCTITVLLRHLVNIINKYYVLILLFNLICIFFKNTEIIIGFYINSHFIILIWSLLIKKYHWIYYFILLMPMLTH